MNKRLALLGLVLAAAGQVWLTTPVTAQEAAAGPAKVTNGPRRQPAQPHTFISAEEIAKRIGAADAAADQRQPISGEPLLFQNGHRVTMEWRNAPQTGINVHLQDSEMFVIIEGSGTMTLGGALVDPHAQPDNPYERATISAREAKGARDYPVKQGDMIMIPAGTPHTVSKVNGKLVLYSMILPDLAAGEMTDKPIDGPARADDLPGR